MNIIEVKAKAEAKIAKQEAIGTKASLARAEKMRQYLNGIENDCGAYGRIIELDTCTKKSTKKRVASQGKNDTYIKMEINGKIRRIACESKINGGRIEQLYKAGAPRFVAYTLDFSNSNGTRELPQMVIPTSVFLAVLEKLNCIKSTNGTNPERAIQHTKKAWFEWLDNYYLPLDPEAIYTEADFEEIEI